jgi:lipid II:glycine glycyltransferase (peptidoglycan interpeptide bridge formation enzyme)
VGEGRLLDSLRDSTVRNIRKAQREGLSTSITTSWESVQTFYRLNCLTRKQHGLPPQPLSFFRQLHTHLINHNYGIVLLIYQGAQPIAGAIFLHQGEKALYKYGASDRRCQHLRANNLVMWEGIRWYAGQGYRSLCFGRTEPANVGLRQFKTGWGASEQTINYVKFDLTRNAFVQEDLLPKLWQTKICSMLPIPVLRAAGELLYGRMG